MVRNPPAGDAGDTGSIPVLGRSPGEGNGNPLQYSCLGNSLDKGTWWATVDRVAKSQTQLYVYLNTYVYMNMYVFGYVQFSLSVMSDSLQPHGLQQARHPCPHTRVRVCI